MCNKITAVEFLDALKSNVNKSLTMNFRHLNIVLVYLARAKQLGATNKDIDEAA
jgi:hypothetical protein